jgi:adenosylcobinamide-phosphate synthase
MLLDAAIGEPRFLWKRIGHPVVWIGRAIAALDARLNRHTDLPDEQRRQGVIAMGCLVSSALLAGLLLKAILVWIPYGWVGELAIASVFLAGRSLYDHVAAVAHAFPDLAAARNAVSMIVGRDPESLSADGVARAAIESTAENFSDGLIAPAFWFLALGLPGIIAYKAINTADSMIGHRTPRHLHFGWAAARLDDAVNWPAARISGMLIALAAPIAKGSTGRAWRVMLRDARLHRSPNAGWPEAAMAGALDLALAGPRIYGDLIVNDRFIHEDGRHEAGPGDISRALRITVGAGLAVVMALIAIGLTLF